MTRRPSPFVLPVFALLALFAISACSDSPETVTIDLNDAAEQTEIEARSTAVRDGSDEYLFGFDLRNGPREDAQQYLPLLDYLTRETGYQFKLHFTKDASELLEKLLSGEVQFAAIGAGTYLTAQNYADIVPLARGVNSAGEPGYRSIMVVAPNSSVERLADLRGKHVAFGSATSTQGHWIPRIMFDEAEIALDDLAEYTFTGSHLACAETVISGRADACGMQDTLAERLISSGALQALARSEIFPSSGIFSNLDVPPEVREAVRTTLIAFDPQGRDRDSLYHWERTEMAGGFVEASAKDYAELRVQAESLGLLQGTPRPVANP